MFRHLLGHDRKLRSLRRGIRAPSRERSCRPRLERLEDRLAPATYTWLGDAGPLWSSPRNWDDADDPKEALKALQDFIGKWKGTGGPDKPRPGPQGSVENVMLM